MALVGGWGVAGAGGEAIDGVTPASELVREFVAAYNRHSVADMMRMVTEDVVWLSVDGEAIAVETRGVAELRTAMEDHFRRRPAAHSELMVVETLGPYVTTHERAVAVTEAGERSQASVAIYEVRDARIARVWYYPAVRWP